MSETRDMSYSPRHVANFMLDRSEKEDIGLSPMKLLKLVYIGYGWVLAVLGEKLFDERIYAWDHGPVVRSLYHEFKHFGRNEITEPSVDFDLDSGEFFIPRIPKDDEETNVVLGKVWDIYKSFSAAALRGKTHEKGTPWDNIYNGEAGPDMPISDDLIAAHFKEKILQYLENARQSGRS